jgi:hypothetical protein
MTARTDVVDLPRIIGRFAARFHQTDGDRQVVASPLGAWLLLALCGRTAKHSLRDELTAILGVDVEAAGGLAERMLETPHAAVASAVAAWVNGNDAEALGPFMDSLPKSVERGARIPQQPELDHWARQRTQGLIEDFPVDVDPDTSLLLASALATRVEWLTPFLRAPAGGLGVASKWARTLTTVLRSPVKSHGHKQFIARTASIGDVAVHTAWSQDGLSVTSVIAMPNVPARDVLAVAHDIATDVAAHSRKAPSLYALPLGDSPIWSITARKVPSQIPGQRTESLSALLPSWKVRSDHNLLGRRLGFEQAALVLSKLASLPLKDIDARQSAMAQFTRLGFEAAAVTGFRASLDRIAPLHTERGIERHAELRFGHPFAVVAVTNDDAWNRTTRAFVRGPWHQLPVFSAWITEPVDDESTPDADERHSDDDDDTGYDRDDARDRSLLHEAGQ